MNCNIRLDVSQYAYFSDVWRLRVVSRTREEPEWQIRWWFLTPSEMSNVDKAVIELKEHIRKTSFYELQH